MEESGSANPTPGGSSSQNQHPPTAAVSEKEDLQPRDVDREPCDITLQCTEPLKEGMHKSSSNLSRPTPFDDSERLRENVVSRRRWNRLLNDNSRGKYYMCPNPRETDMMEEMGHYPYIFLWPALANLLYKGRSGASRLGEFTKRLLAALGRTVVAVLQFIIMESLGLLTMNMVGEAVHHRTLDRELEKAMDPQALGLQEANGDLESGVQEEMEMISGPIIKDHSNDQRFPSHAQTGQTCQKEAKDN